MRKSLIKSLHYWKQWATAKQGSEKERGLTLIEMLAVVVILGIVAAIAIPAVSTAITQSKVNATESTLGTLQTALSRYELDNGSYPPNLSDLLSTSPTTPTATGASTLSTYTAPSTWNGPYIQDVFPLTDAWGHKIWYVPIASSGTATAPITGYLLLSGDGQALSVPSTAPTSGADLDLGPGSTPPQYTLTDSLIYAAGGSAYYIGATGPTLTYLGVGPAKGVLPGNLYDVIDATTASPITPVPVND